MSSPEPKPMRIAVVGAGMMGRNWIRVVSQSQHELGLVIDTDRDQAAQIEADYGVATSRDLADVAGCDAVVVATSTETHADLALQVIAAGRPLLVEKPLATDIADVRRVIDAAAASNIPLMCGFVERFNPAVRTARQLITDPLLHIVALRHSAPDPRNKSSAAFDLLIHDIDLSLSFAGNDNLSKVMGGQVIAPGASRADVADCILTFDTGLMATLSASRLGQRKIRVLHLMTANTLYEVDLLRADVTVYQHVGHEMERGGYRAQTIVDIPFVRHAGEPLALELEHFVSLANGQINPETERASILPAHVAADAIDKS